MGTIVAKHRKKPGRGPNIAAHKSRKTGKQQKAVIAGLAETFLRLPA